MPLEVFPQNIVLFPNDRQRFVARSLKGTDNPYWANEFACFVRPDFSLEHEPLKDTSQFFADGAHQLESGNGSIEFTLTANCLPGVGQFQITLQFQDNATVWLYIVA